MPTRMPNGEVWGQWSARCSTECGPLAAAAWAAIRRRTGPRGEAAAVRLADLAAEVGRSPETLRRVLRRLDQAGWLARRRTGRENLFSALIPAAEHIETGQKCPVRAGKNDRSDRSKMTGQSGQKCPVAPGPIKDRARERGVERDREKEGEGEAVPPPPDARGAETAEDRVLASLAPGGASAPLHAAVRNALADARTRTVTAAEVLVHLAEAGPGRPWERVAKAADLALAARAETRRAEFRRRLCEIADTPLGQAWRRSQPSRLARVESVDPDAGRLVLVEWQDGCRGDRTVLDSPEALDRWAFEAAEPTLFALGDGPPAGGARQGVERSDLLPADPAVRPTAARLLAVIGERQYATWFARASSLAWRVQAGEVCVEPRSPFVGDYVRSHFAAALGQAGVVVKAAVQAQGDES